MINVVLVAVQIAIMGGLYLFLDHAYDSGWWAVFAALPFVIAWATWVLSEPWERNLYRSTARRLVSVRWRGRE